MICIKVHESNHAKNSKEGKEREGKDRIGKGREGKRKTLI